MHENSIRKERIAEIVFITALNFSKLEESYQDFLERTNIACDGGYYIPLLEEDCISIVWRMGLW
jgi:hypothetical protein